MFFVLHLNADIFYLWHNSQSLAGRGEYFPHSFLPGTQVMVGNLLPTVKKGRLLGVRPTSKDATLYLQTK